MQPPAPIAPALRSTSATYPGSAEYISAVRADLRALLADCPIADDVILCASELAANAALHSHSRLPGGTFTVCTTVSQGHYVRIDVEDSGGPWMPVASEPIGHHGLGVVRALAKEWGIEGDHSGHTVWATFHWGRAMTDTRHTRQAHRWTAVVDGRRLQELRRQHGLAQEVLASQAGISRRTLFRLERQQNASCRTRTLARLAAALGEQPSSIATGIDGHAD